MIDWSLRIWGAAIYLSGAILSARASHNSFVITSISPESGPTSGGTEIILTGSGDIGGNELACVFEGSEGADNETDVLSWAQSVARWISPTDIVCTAPKWDFIPSSNVTLSLEVNGAPVAVAPSSFHYYEAPVESISPTFGHVTGGTRVTFRMKESVLTDVSHCVFGDRVVPVIVDQSNLVCVSPPMSRIGQVYVGVSVDGEHFSMSLVQFEYSLPAVFWGMHPSSGSESGGTVVTFTGVNFANSSTVACFFGNIEVAGRWISNERLTCETSAMKPGNYNVLATLNGVDTHHTNQTFIVHPRITALISSPSFGIVGGGTSIHVYGTNYRPEEVMKCRFGVVSVDATYVGPNMIECRSPKWEAAESVELTIVSGISDAAVVHSGFEFYHPFQVLSIHPSNGLVRGGTEVTVKGKHFSQSHGLVNCLFGDTAVKAVVEADSVIRCSAPPVSIGGDVEFALSYGSDRFELPLQRFQYEYDIRLDSVSPRTVLSGTNKLITVFGSIFKNSTEISCMIAENKLPMEAIFVSESEVLCRVPRMLNPGTYSLRVSNNEQDYSEAALQFNVIDPVLIKSLSPLHGSPNMTHIVSLHGTQFHDLDNVTCLVDDHFIVPSHFINNTLMQCSLPLNVADRGTVSITLLLDGEAMSTGPQLLFTFINLSVNSISPTCGHVTGGTRVTFRMEESVETVVSHCVFGGRAVPVIVDQSNLVCVSPPASRIGPVYVGVSVDGEHFSMSLVQFEYTLPAVFLGMHPSSGPETGGTVVTFTGVNFANSSTVACFFGNIEVAGRWISNERLSCETSAMKPGNYKVRVTFNGIDTIRTPWRFTSQNTIDILYAIPSNGSFGGGTEVSIIGKSFTSTEFLACKFGNLGSSKATFITSTEIKCISPPFSSSEHVDVDIQISLNGVDFSAATARFRFTPDERWSNFTASSLLYSYTSIMNVSPQYVFADGGDIISLFGHNLNITDEVWCRFTLPSHNDGSNYYEIVQGSKIRESSVDCQVPTYPLASMEMEAFVEVSTNGQDYASSRLSFNYAQKPKILGFYPTLGSVNGGTVVTVSGTDFIRESKLWCVFGHSESPALWISHNEIACTTPSVEYPVNDTLSLHFEGNTRLSEVSSSFAYHQELSLVGAFPMRGFVSGGTIVTVQGKVFLDVPTLTCYFGNRAVAAKIVSINSIECQTPSVNKSQEVELKVSLNGVDVSALPATSERTFVFDNEVDLFRTIPSIVLVPSDPTSYLTVIGSSFINTTSTLCQFGRNQSTVAQFVSATVIRCGLPTEIEVMESEVGISFNGVDFSTKTTSVLFTKPALILSIVPERIHEGQEVEILVRGENFIYSPDLQCRFGRVGHLWSPARWMDQSTLKCLTPILNASHDGFEYVGICINGGHDRERKTFPLQVTPRAQFHYMHPALGYVDGGTEVVITFGNANYFSNLVCQFEGEEVSGLTLSANSVVCKSPSYRPKELTLKLISGKEVLASGAFEYILPPIATELDPSTGTLEGGTTVRISGSGFLGVTHCRFRFDDDIKIVRASVESDSTLSCDSPASDNEIDASVEVTHNGQDFIRTGRVFKYRAPPRLLGLTPTYGSDLGGKNVYITGEHFADISTKCSFGSSLVDAIYISQMLLQCVAPELEIGFFPVSITWNGVDFMTNETLIYESIQLPQINSIVPRVGTVNGGTIVSLESTALHEHKTLACHFGGQTVPASYQSSNSALCVAPRVDAIGDVEVSFSVGGEHLFVDALNPIVYSYVSDPEVTLISPKFGSTTGGAEVSLSVKNFGPFKSSYISCSFGEESRFADAVRVNDDLVVCRSPPHSGVTMMHHAPISLRISDRLNELVVKSPTFTYLEPPLVTNVEPPYGSIHGGTVVRVAGLNFPLMSGLQCLFGEDIIVDAEFVDEREVICVLPEWSGGSRKVDVHIGTRDGPRISHASHAVFEYLDHPSIESIRPRYGDIKGGTRVALLGNALSWPNAPKYLSCRFGNSSMVPVESSSKNEVVCASPPGTGTGPISLYATFGHLWLASSDESYVYTHPIELDTLLPDSGPSSGGTAVTISARGLHLLPKKSLTCHFGDEFVPATFDEEESALKCTSPSVEDSSFTKAVLVNLGINGSRTIDSVGRVFTFYRPLSIIWASPTFGFIDGGEDVSIHGYGFRNSEGLGCKFGDAVSPKAVWLSDTVMICTSPLARTNMTKAGVPVQITNNGVDYTDWKGAPKYMFTYRPDASLVEPDIVNWSESTNITIKGKNLIHVSACWFGIINKTYTAFNVTNNSVQCEAPSAEQLPITLLPLLSRSSIPIFLYLKNGILATGLDIKYDGPSPRSRVQPNQPDVVSIIPTFGSSQGGDWIRIQGKGFLNTEELACRFGGTVVEPVNFLSASEIQCRTPTHVPGPVLFDVVNRRVARAGDDRVSGIKFTFLLDLSIIGIVPSSGSINGGTEVHLFGSFPSLSIDGAKLSIVCKFGMYGLVTGEFLSQNEIRCLSSPSALPGNVEVSVSLDSGQNFAKSTSWFAYVFESEIQSLNPNYGYSKGGTSVVLVGRNFMNTTGLKCLFGETSVDAIFQSTHRVSCVSPPYNRSMNVKVAVVKLVSEGRIGSSWKHFEYADPPRIDSINPLIGQSGEGGGTVTVIGSGFRPMMHLLCVFGKLNVRSTVVDDTMMLCDIPRHPSGVVDFRIIDQNAPADQLSSAGNESSSFRFIPKSSIYSVNKNLDAAYPGSLLLTEGTNFDVSRSMDCRFGTATAAGFVVADSLILCPNLIDDWVHEEVLFSVGMQAYIHSAESYIIEEPRRLPNVPNGTEMDRNFTLCEPGTFKPQSGQGRCLPCPIGFMCPSFGLSTPMVCPAGWICDRLALVLPSSKCISGHYCKEGTKSQYPISLSTTDAWYLEEDSGILMAVLTNNIWGYMPRKPPATGARRIFHPPIGNVISEQPIPCPVGYFCREGVSSAEYREGDYTTPQPCSDGFFCSIGSTKPVGTGACPTGYYCPTQVLAIPCEPGHYCPGTGNVYPLPCFPGSYSSTSGQSSCKMCEIGFQCPGFNRTFAEPCQAGWVCDEEGLSVPYKLCPSGFICEEGTTTDDPNYGVGIMPKPCPAGSFCLEGVAHNSTSGWLPSFEMGMFAPQPCLEGYFCPENSSTPLGGGRCSPGSYCPNSSPYPVQTPPGSFYGDDGGAIVGSLCLPGKFSPRPGQITCSPCPAGSACLGYGTYNPRICGPGTYRSKADSVQSVKCKSCPEQTYSFDTGLTDISECLPCAEGQVCGLEGMIDLKQSDACSEGSVCGYNTARSTQFLSQCPAGSYCGYATTTFTQYSNDCVSGHFCNRGTTSNLNSKDKCTSSHYCLPGTPEPDPLLSRCPRQTSSQIGAESMLSCIPKLVAICDKKPSIETNPYDRLSYYPNVDQGASTEMLVVAKIFPLDEATSDVVSWMNDTVEVFRACPSYGLLPDKSSTEPGSRDLAVTVIGRNFLNSTALTCRYKICLGSRWVSESGVAITTPGLCHDQESTLSEAMTTSGVYISKTRVSCPFHIFDPVDDFAPINRTDSPSSLTVVCLRNEKGQLFLSQHCSATDLASDECSFEVDAPFLGLRKRVYSLVMPCSEDEIDIGECSHVPTTSSKLNPCLTQQMMVDISNMGRKFSSEGTVIPYTSLHENTYNHLGSSFQVLPTYATYEFIPEGSLRVFEFESSAIDNKRLRSSFGDDRILCNRSSTVEEGWRLGEHGWFESPYMSRFHISLDWRHLPDRLVYDKHFRLAIYVFPSRCVDSKCSGPEHSQIEEVHVPCLQPIDLPVRFSESAFNKHRQVNLTLTSLDDSRFQVEVQVVDGLATPLANLFKKTLSVTVEHPRRANMFHSKRRISPLVSFEEKSVEMPYIFGIRYDEGHSQRVSLPRNLPPRWKMFERGRVLIGINSTDNNAATIIKDKNVSNSKGSYFWDNPHTSGTAAKEQSDLYFETFRGVSQDGPGSYKYQHSSLILPYLPYFSKCNEFDSYIPLWALLESATQCHLPGVSDEFPIDWWRRKMPPLPHEDDIKPIGPMDFAKFYPVADWCERELHCRFEEDLPNPDVTPRWFEAETGTSLFSIIRDPIDYYQYTGRDSTIVGSNDGGGQRFTDSTNVVQMFIPAKVDKSSSLYVAGGCAVGACFPRKVTIDISYHQLDSKSKRIVEVKVVYDKFDKDPSNDRYDLQIKFYALTYEELVVKFAFSRGLFLLLFTQIGVGTVGAAAIYWGIVRLTTNVERPPRLRVFNFLWLSFLPALWGVLLGLVPIIIVTVMVYYLMKGYLIFTPVDDFDGRHWLFPSTTRLHYSDVDIEPEHLQSTRQGRTGLAFVTMGLTSFYWTTQMFVPNISSSEQENARDLVGWKRGNFIFSSVTTSLFLIIIMEWSFSASFGTYIWEAQIFLGVLGIFVGFLVNKQLGDDLLGVPVMTAVGLVQVIVTMSADDFIDFLLSYIVGFGFLIIGRMYRNPLQADVIERVHGMFISLDRLSKVSLNRILGGSYDEGPIKSSEIPPGNNNQAVEPLLGSYASYSGDALSLLYTPFIMIVIMAFRDEVEITKLYGIKEDDMEYYVIFALAIIPFQVFADIFFHNALELLHGWKILEYLEYCNVRFLQREMWWKGLEKNTLDECIEDSLKKIDQMCFSSQYYMLNTIHLNAMLYFILGIEMMTRAKYTVFGDPIVIPLAASIILISVAVKSLLTSIARRFGLWKIKHEKKSWHAMIFDTEVHPNIERTEATLVDSQTTLVEQRITSESFRYKFLSYNRSWILSQLPELITPRVCDSQKPYMINQFARILSELNEDLSSDSDSDDGPKFDTPVVTDFTRTLARTWLEQAGRQLKLNKLVQPLIMQAKGNECQLCLSRSHLRVETLRSMAEIDKLFRDENPTEEVDQVLFKRFWKRHQRYQTVCLSCVQKRQNYTDDDRPCLEEPEYKLTSQKITQSTEIIMLSWYATARRRLKSVDERFEAATS